jgi:hypothetical protein
MRTDEKGRKRGCISLLFQWNYLGNYNQKNWSLWLFSHDPSKHGNRQLWLSKMKESRLRQVVLALDFRALIKNSRELPNFVTCRPFL